MVVEIRRRHGGGMVVVVARRMKFIFGSQMTAWNTGKKGRTAAGRSNLKKKDWTGLD